MNRDRVKGTINEVVGTVKRNSREWTGDMPLQVMGIVQQVRGKLENSMGRAKEAIPIASENVEIHRG